MVMPAVDIAYETYGRLAADGKNAVLVTHGYTSSHHAAGHTPANGGQPGWWDGLIGPGKAIGTRPASLSSPQNMLGSSTTARPAGASLDPRTGKPYGSDFPAITVRDIVTAQKALLDSLGVRHLVAVAGPSYGGYQAFQWAVAYPEMIDAVAAVVTAPRSQNAEKSLAELEARLAADPEWHGGHYYGHGGAKTALTQMRFETLMRYGYRPATGPPLLEDKTRAQSSAIRQLAVDWARNWDTNSLVILRRATVGFDTVKDFAKIRAENRSTCCAAPTCCFRRPWRPASYRTSPPPGSTRAISSSTAISAIRRQPRARQMVAGIARAPGAVRRPPLTHRSLARLPGARVRASPDLARRQAEARDLDRRAAVHHHLEALRLGAGNGGIVAHLRAA